MREYFEIAKPLISVTMSTAVTTIVRSDFTRFWTYDIDKIAMLPQVGELTIQHFTDPGACTGKGKGIRSAAVNANDCTIQIPFLHPGHNNYTAGRPQLRRLST